MSESHQKKWTKNWVLLITFASHSLFSYLPNPCQNFDNGWNGSTAFLCDFSHRFAFCVIKPIGLSRTFNALPDFPSPLTLTLCGLFEEINLIVKSLQNGENKYNFCTGPTRNENKSSIQSNVGEKLLSFLLQSTYVGLKNEHRFSISSFFKSFLIQVQWKTKITKMFKASRKCLCCSEKSN